MKVKQINPEHLEILDVLGIKKNKNYIFSRWIKLKTSTITCGRSSSQGITVVRYILLDVLKSIFIFNFDIFFV